MQKESPGVPRHVAIIPDGNRRWAKKRGLKPWEGHFKGISEFSENIAWAAFDMGVEYLTAWGGSYDNLTKRSKIEIRMLNEAYRRLIKRVMADGKIHERGVRVRFIGEINVLEKSTQDLINEVETATKNYKKHNLTILVAYNGDKELLSAINKLVKSDKKITAKTLRSSLWTGELPPVDFVIRAGGEYRLSTFMPWDIGYAELYFTKKLWPDFTKNDLKRAIKDYQSRERRFGK